MLTQKRLKELLSYDPETGLFTRLVTVCNQPAGKVLAGYNNGNALHISVLGRRWKCHRLAWFYMTGDIPRTGIDHRDGDICNNRFSNLRLANQVQNMQNLRAAHRDSCSGLLGVSWHKGARKWIASIRIEKKRLHLGLFDDPDTAHAAYLAAKVQAHPFQTLVDQAA